MAEAQAAAAEAEGSLHAAEEAEAKVLKEYMDSETNPVLKPGKGDAQDSKPKLRTHCCEVCDPTPPRDRGGTQQGSAD